MPMYQYSGSSLTYGSTILPTTEDLKLVQIRAAPFLSLQVQVFDHLQLHILLIHTTPLYSFSVLASGLFLFFGLACFFLYRSLEPTVACSKCRISAYDMAEAYLGTMGRQGENHQILRLS